MSGNGSRQRIGSATSFVSQALILILLLVPIQGVGDLEADVYGEISFVEPPEPASPEEVAVGSEEVVAASEEVGSPETGRSGGSGVDEEFEDGEEDGEATIAEAVVYVFNRDDDTLSVSLFIDSQLMGTEDISKDKEKKFGEFPLKTGPHTFKITWWDDDTKKTHQEEIVALVEGVTAVTVYTTRNTAPEKFDVNVMLRNDNKEDLEAYLYINGEYERLKTAKKESTTDLGKFSIEEGTHILAVRWQDPATKIEYENRKTVRVEGKTVVTFYAPKGMTFETEERGETKTVATRTATTTAAAPTARAPLTNEGGDEDASSQAGMKGAAGPSSNPEAAKPGAEKNAGSDPEEKGDFEDEPSHGRRTTLYLSTIGAILAIYVAFFRR